MLLPDDNRSQRYDYSPGVTLDHSSGWTSSVLTESARAFTWYDYLPCPLDVGGMLAPPLPSLTTFNYLIKLH